MAHDRYWELIRNELAARSIDGPAGLTVEPDEQRAWTDPHLMMSQTCGMPYRNGLHGKVTLVGTPDYALDGCPPGYYRSAIVVRSDDSREQLQDFSAGMFAYNSAHSQSGYNAMLAHIAPLRISFAESAATGGHLASARAVADESADIAALDAMSWRLMQRYDDFVTELRVLEWTEPTPGLPYIGGVQADRNAMFDAISTAIEQLSNNDRALLGIERLVDIPSAGYLAVPNML